MYVSWVLGDNRRSCAGAEERSAWSSVGSCRLDCTNAQSSQTGRLLPMIQLRLGRPTDQKESSAEGLSQNHQNSPFSIRATDLTTGDYRGSGLVQWDVMEDLP